MKQRPDVKLVSVPQFDLEARKASAPGCGETPRELTMLRSNWLHPSLPRTSSRLTVRWTRRLEAQLRNNRMAPLRNATHERFAQELTSQAIDANTNVHYLVSDKPMTEEERAAEYVTEN
jgi:hypothetical protein